jgi:hypothetical protein
MKALPSVAGYPDAIDVSNVERLKPPQCSSNVLGVVESRWAAGLNHISDALRSQELSSEGSPRETVDVFPFEEIHKFFSACVELALKIGPTLNADRHQHRRFGPSFQKSYFIIETEIRVENVRSNENAEIVRFV